MSGGVDIRIVEDEAGLDALRPAWRSLAARLGRPCLFLTWEWLAGWWRQADRSGRRLFILLASNGDEPAGIAPLVIREHRPAGFPVRAIELMSMEEYAFSPRNVSGELGFIVPPRSGGEAGIVAAFMDHIAGSRVEWDYLRFHPLPAGSPTLEGVVRWAGSSGFSCDVRAVMDNSVIALPPTWEEYLGSLSPSFRKTLRHAANAVAKAGGCSVRTVTEAPDPAALVEAMAAVERSSWKHTGGLGLDRPEVRASYEFRVKAAAELGGLEAWFLERDGRAIACDFVVRLGDVVESLRGSFDAGWSRLSPGNHLIALELESFVRKGIRRVNFQWGDLAYKLKWSPLTETCHEIYLFNRTPKAQALRALYYTSGLYRAIRFLSNYSDRRKR